MFRLSNKIVQVNFQDHTEILLNSENRYVTYVNKKGERSTMPLNQALDSNNAEMTKRLKYTKDILTHMLNNNQANPNPPRGNPTQTSSDLQLGGQNSTRRAGGQAPLSAISQQPTGLPVGTPADQIVFNSMGASNGSLNGQ
jgi:hypothetical protein